MEVSASYHVQITGDKDINQQGRSVEFVNYTPFPALAYQALDQYEQCFHVVAMRSTSEIKTYGTLQFTPEQTPLAVTDDYHGELNKSSVRQESDLAPFKHKCDVIVIGKAYAPAGRPARRFTVGFNQRPEAAASAAAPPPGPQSHHAAITGCRCRMAEGSGWRPAPIRSRAPLFWTGSLPFAGRDSGKKVRLAGGP